ncbi:unconventional myosin-VIIa-like [Leucoraja erinacea]|uniref:unconventional myosin-VIIa-like n=1 Tax=Leucoraja erinaceus TaxID=7782 RepID=UPI0024538668|nr:unconventional myosin-VIIa-like [Leucoraja erinacea]
MASGFTLKATINDYTVTMQSSRILCPTTHPALLHINFCSFEANITGTCPQQQPFPGPRNSVTLYNLPLEVASAPYIKASQNRAQNMPVINLPQSLFSPCWSINLTGLPVSETVHNSGFCWQGDHVWVHTSIGGEFSVPMGAEVKRLDRGKTLLLDDEGKELWIDGADTHRVKHMHPTSVREIDDMICIEDLNEAGMLRNLHIRYRKDVIYTYTGSILVALNPYQQLPIYTSEQISQYTNRRIQELPPHIFAIADSCYFSLRKSCRDQCCIISGESGAGKTENTKLILKFLAAVSGQHQWIEQQILEANPILEAFGNAKTVKNDNSSRFGKYIDIFFSGDGMIEGARIEQYLLEKSRVCQQAPDERNYHVFYSLLMGMKKEQKQLLGLGAAHEFDYLTMGNCTSCTGHDDVGQYADICSAMKILMFSDKEQWDINKLLAAVLHLGNLKFQAAVYNNLDCCELLSSSHLSMATKLLEVDLLELENGMTNRSILIRGESVSTPMSKAWAAGNRDALAKAIYSHLFVWIVNKVNAVTYTQPANNSGKASSIGLLDIFGFENFDLNSFEQLCINYANEQLQQFFVRHLFKEEQAEYLQENIDWLHIDFVDNQKVLDVLSIKPMSIISLIDEESKLLKGTDRTMLNKLNNHHSNSGIYFPPKSSHDTKFGISHFAGVVYYDSNGFLEKNRDDLSFSIAQVVHSSSNTFLTQIFQASTGTTPRGKANHRNIPHGGSIKASNVSWGSIQQANDSHKRLSTLCSQFKQSLDNLMKTLRACQPFFIRCIKPNDYKKPLLFDRELCTKQLRYSGMKETIRIRKSGYPIRFTFKDFVQKYKITLRSALWQYTEDDVCLRCKQIAESVIGVDGGWKIGKTKIFLKEGHHLTLELEQERILTTNILIIQKRMRGFKDRKNFLRVRAAAQMIQSHWRGQRCRQEYRLMRHGFERLQALYHAQRMVRQYQDTRRRVILFQARCQGYLARINHNKRIKALVTIQAYTTGMLIRRTYRIMRRDIEGGAEARKLGKKGGQRRVQLVVAMAEDETDARNLAKMTKQDMMNERRLREEYLRTQQQEENHDPINDLQMVDRIFSFLPNVLEDQEKEGPREFEDLEVKRQRLEEFDLDDTSISSDTAEEDDLSQFTFSKYAATYFQGSSTATHIRRPLRHPLLFHEEQVDVLASLAVWNVILRFMGDLPEPKPFAKATEKTRNSIMTRIYDSLSRKSKAFMTANQATDEVWCIRELLTNSMFHCSMWIKAPSQLEQCGQGRLPPVQGPPWCEVLYSTDLATTMVLMIWWPNLCLEAFRCLSGTATDWATTLTSPCFQSLSPEKRKKCSKHQPSSLNSLSGPTPGEEMLLDENPVADRPMSNLEKLHFIIGNAIARPSIRDEIYCQICKQLSNCYNKNAYARGWILLSLCVGCFPASESFMKYLRSFIRTGPAGYASYCEERLRRTTANGARTEPPSYLELEASKTKQPMKVTVTLMSGTSYSVSIDSATTAQELCRALASRTGLTDSFGFSIYIALYQKVSSLGSGADHILDAISQCEQYVKGQGRQERHAAWRLLFRKEIFTPWHDCGADPVSTDLIYQQILRGIRFGEYEFEEEELVNVAANLYYVNFGTSDEAVKGLQVVKSCISDKLLQIKSPEDWSKQIMARVKGLFSLDSPEPLTLKAQLVDLVRLKWPLLFSRFFEAAKFSGPTLPRNKLVVAINWASLSFVDENEKVLLKRSFLEITGVTTNRALKLSGQSVTVSTLQGEEYTLTSGHAADIADLLLLFLNGLKVRSEYAVSLLNSPKQDDPIFLKFEKGDLIKLLKTEELTPPQDHGWVQGWNERTGKTGSLSLQSVYIIPILEKPSSDVMSLIRMSPDQRRQAAPTAPAQEVDTKHYTLEEFSYLHFRPPSKESMSRAVFPKARVKDLIWACSREPLRLPLLKKVCLNPEMVQVACQAFIAIMKYMGDYPGKLSKSGTQLTDQIFSGALREEVVQDEVYCQIMKQLTHNRNRYSVEGGWQLLWLCTGLFPPSSLMFPHVEKFLKSHSKEKLSTECVQRLAKAKRSGARRNPPHVLEVEAIQCWSTTILHKIYFPNDTDQAFEIFTNTKAKTLCETITKHLGLGSSEGLSLFVQVENKVISIPEGDFFFDCVTHVSDWVRKEKRVPEGLAGSVSYKVLFMRMLWINILPGRDLKADLLLHFPQELPKYLRGYHSCTRDDAVQVAAFLYKVKFNDDKSQFVNIPKLLKDLVPQDMLRMMSPEEWKKAIVAIVNKHAGKTRDEVKLAFLKLLHRLPTFGSAFFDVKQTSEPTFPDIIRIAINRQGVTVINPRTKEPLVTHPFNKISNWCSGSTYFHMSVGSMMKGERILCETSLGYKMDDLLTSYVSAFVAARQRSAGNPAA